MARSTADRSRSSAASLREQLAEAPAYLSQAGAPPYIAEALDAVLAPSGWERLRVTDPARDEGSKNLAINMSASIRDEIWAAHEADKSGLSLTARVNEGFNAYLAGRFEPLKRAARHGVQPEGRANMNVTASALLQRQVRDLVRQRVSDPRKGPAWVAAEWLMSEFEVGPYAPDLEPSLERGSQRNAFMPRRLRDEIRARAKESGARVDDIVNEGYQKFLDGQFDAQPLAWSEQDAADLVSLKIHPNDGLFEQAKAACKAHALLNAKTGPNLVAVDYLLEEFGLSDQVAGSE